MPDPARRLSLLRSLRRLVPFAPPLLLALLAIGVAAGGEAAARALRYEREAILAGEGWRLLSAHLTHLNWGHLWLNLAGLALVWGLYGPVHSPVRWGLFLLVGGLGVGIGLLLLDPALAWYVGLSGVLHGLLVAGAVGAARQGGGRGAWAVLCLVALKLGWEQALGPLPGTAQGAGGPVVVDAHLYGAVVVGLAAFLLPARERVAA